jgi:hypothetical protein
MEKPRFVRGFFVAPQSFCSAEFIDGGMIASCRC